MLDRAKQWIQGHRGYFLVGIAMLTTLVAWGGDEINFGQLLQALYTAISGIF